MLDQQFFGNEKMHLYLNDNFIAVHAVRGEKMGDALYKKFSVQATPTIVLAQANGQEIDRLIGYGPPAEKFKDKIEKTYKGKNTLLKLLTTHKKNPEDLDLMIKIAKKYESHYNIPNMGLFGQKILKQPEKAKQLSVGTWTGREKIEISAYEFAKYMATYADSRYILEFISEFPESKLKENVINNISSHLYSDKKEDEKEKAFNTLNILLDKYPNNLMLIRTYGNYGLENKAYLDNSTDMIEKFYNQNSNDDDLMIIDLYSRLLIENSKIEKVNQIVNKYLNKKPKNAERLLESIGYFYNDKKNYQQALATFEKLIDLKPDSYNAYYQIGRTAALSGKYLDRGIEGLLEYLKHDPSTGKPSHAAAHWRLGMIYEHKTNKRQAIAEYNESLKLDPNYKSAKEALEKIKQ